MSSRSPLSELKYSVIVAVYNRIEEVRELLYYVENLTYPRNKFELLFVDDGSQDGFQEYIESYQVNSRLPIRLLKQQNQGPGKARNYGMQEAQGEYFIFIDSDCFTPPDWLTRIDEALTEHSYDAFGGPDTWHDSFSPLLKAISYCMTSFIGTGGARGSKTSVAKFYPRSFNMGLHRRVYEKIGGMNNLRHGQDMDYSARIDEAGFRMGFIPDAFIYHRRRTSVKKYYRQIFNWGIARIHLCRLHPFMLKPVHLLPSALLVIGSLLVFATLLFPLLLAVWTGIGLLWSAVMALVFIQSFRLFKSVKISFLSMFLIQLQVFAYGAGLLQGATQWLLGKEVKGYRKNYYGKKSLESR